MWPPASPPGRAGRVALWLAGADPTLLLTRTERAEYAAAGVAVGCAGVFAASSMTAALTLALAAPVLLAAAVGLLWGLTLGNLDRWIVSSPKDPTLPLGARGTQLAVRVLLALLLGVVISEPIVLRLFAPEIDAELRRQAALAEQTAQADAEALVAADRDRIARERDALSAAVAAAQDAVAAADAAFQAEGGDANSSPAAARFNHDARRARQRLTQAQARQQQQTARLDTEAAALDAQVQTAAARLADTSTSRDGLLASEQALSALTSRQPGLALRRWVITGLFVLVELLPVLLKALRPPSGHDRLTLELAAVRVDLTLAHARAAAHAERAAIQPADPHQTAHAAAAATADKAVPDESPAGAAAADGTDGSTTGSTVTHPADLREGSTVAAETWASLDPGSVARPPHGSPQHRLAAAHRGPVPPGGWTSRSLAKACRVSQRSAARFLNHQLTAVSHGPAPPQGWTPEALAERCRVSQRSAARFLNHRQQQE